MMSALGYFAFPIAQVNIGVSFASYLGLLQALGALGYFAVSVAQVIIALKSHQIDDIVIRILQLLLAPLILLQSGAILFFNGWRLDPVLQLQQFLPSFLIAYLIFLDWKRSNRTTQQ